MVVGPSCWQVSQLEGIVAEAEAAALAAAPDGPKEIGSIHCSKVPLVESGKP